MTDPITLFKQATDAVRKGEDASQYFDPDYVIYQDAGMPYGGAYKGAEGFVRCYWMVHNTFGPNCFEDLFTCTDPSGEHLSKHFKLSGHPAGAAERVEGFVTVVWTFRNDLALETRAYYYDTPGFSKGLEGVTFPAS